MRDRTDLIVQDLLRRVGELEIELHGSGDSVARLLQGLKSQVDENGSIRDVVNDLENRVILLEERTGRSAENQNLRTLVLLLNRWPGGTCGLLMSLVALNAAISLMVEAIGAATVLRSILGL
jgi:hypothetical protein